MGGVARALTTTTGGVAELQREVVRTAAAIAGEGATAALALCQGDAMQLDFLGPGQHELPTPLTAILGLSDLIEMCWDVWEEKPKLDAVRDIQLAARNLYETVETIIDFTALNAETVSISPDEL